MLSVVIPAFNAEKYIGECIRSVTCQISEKSKIQVVVVIDGATDNTATQAAEARRGYESSVRIVVQENRGASAARNKGVSLVTTQYTTFLDADDTWSKDYVKSVAPALRLNPDLVEYDACFVDNNDKLLKELKISALPSGHVGEVSKKDFLRIFRCYAWARIYRTSDLLKHPFPEGRRLEDTATTPWFYWNSASILGIAKPLVRYRQHPQSVLATPAHGDVTDIANCIKESIQRYNLTRDPYWIATAYKTHHFACNRIAKLPPSTWMAHSKTSRAAIAGTAPPHLSGAAQLYLTPLYVALLKVKRLISTLTRSH